MSKQCQGEVADEAELIGRIAELERLKSAAAAEQARAAAALDERRRAVEAAEGMPAAKRGNGVAGEVALRDVIPHRAAIVTWDSPKPWCTKCRIHEPLWNVVRSQIGAPH